MTLSSAKKWVSMFTAVMSACFECGWTYSGCEWSAATAVPEGGHQTSAVSALNV